MKRYFAILDMREDEIPTSPKSWAESVLESHGCRKCHLMSPRTPIVDVVVSQEPVSEYTVTTICVETGLLIIREEFLSDIGWDVVKSCLLLADVYVEGGRKIPDFRAVVGKERLPIRGGPSTFHRLCDSCGRLIYDGRGRSYFTAAQVKSQAPVYEYLKLGLVVEEAIRDRLYPKWSKKVRFIKIPVIEKPLDGLPADFPLWPTKEQLVGYKPRLQRPLPEEDTDRIVEKSGPDPKKAGKVDSPLKGLGLKEIAEIDPLFRQILRNVGLDPGQGPQDGKSRR